MNTVEQAADTALAERGAALLAGLGPQDRAAIEALITERGDGKYLAGYRDGIRDFPYLSAAVRESAKAGV